MPTTRMVRAEQRYSASSFCCVLEDLCSRLFAFSPFGLFLRLFAFFNSPYSLRSLSLWYLKLSLLAALVVPLSRFAREGRFTMGPCFNEHGNTADAAKSFDAVSASMSMEIVIIAYAVSVIVSGFNGAMLQ